MLFYFPLLFLYFFQKKHCLFCSLFLYIFSAIEIWSVGENIEKRGGVNLPKRVFHLLPEKIQKILKQEE